MLILKTHKFKKIFNSWSALHGPSSISILNTNQDGVQAIVESKSKKRSFALCSKGRRVIKL